jgi:hypothetical protein
MGVSIAILAFFNYYSRNEPNETFFQNMALLSRANQSGVTYEVVVPIHLALLKGLARAQSPRWLGWCHVEGPEKTTRGGG